jgi:hypothetical protein
MTTYLHIGVYFAYFESYLVTSLLRQGTQATPIFAEFIFEIFTGPAINQDGLTGNQKQV